MTKERIKLYRSANEGEETVADLAFEMSLRECNIGTNSSIAGEFWVKNTTGANAWRQKSTTVFLEKIKISGGVEFVSVICGK